MKSGCVRRDQRRGMGGGHPEVAGQGSLVQSPCAPVEGNTGGEASVAARDASSAGGQGGAARAMMQDAQDVVVVGPSVSWGAGLAICGGVPWSPSIWVNRHP